MKARYLIALALTAYLFGLLWLLPVATAVAWAPPLPVRLQGLDGRLLAGRAASLELGSGQRLEEVHWRFRPSALLRGLVAASVDFSYLDGAGSGLLGIDWQRSLRLDEGRWQIAAARLGEVLGIPLAEFAGQLEARVEQASWQAGRLRDLRGRLDWRAAELRQPLALSLGEVSAEISGDAQGYVAELSNREGALSVQGQLRLVGQRLQADLRLRPLAGAPPELAELLGGVARRQGDGSYRLQRSLNLGQLL